MPSLKTVLGGLVKPRESSKGQDSMKPPMPPSPSSATRKWRRHVKIYTPGPSPARAPSPYPVFVTTSQDQPSKTNSQESTQNMLPRTTWSSYKKAQEVAIREEEERSVRENLEQERMSRESEEREKESRDRSSIQGPRWRDSREIREWLHRVVDSRK
ncbi:hypothetical protein BKA81DRAFT_407522 [Phyllosticta paracitricarpa]